MSENKQIGCSVEGCRRPYHAKNLCSKHYKNRHYKNNAEKYKKSQRNWRASNLEKAHALSRKWNAENRELMSVINHHRFIFNSDCSNYKNYRGMPFFDDWNPDKGGSFKNGADWIIANLGKRPENHTLHVIHHDVGFVPGNLEWAPRKVQNVEQLRFIVGQQRREIEERDAYIEALEMVLDVQRDFRMIGLRPETEVIQ